MQVARDALIERILCALRTMHIGDLVSRALKWAYLPAAPILILWSIESWDHPLLAYVMQVRTGPLLDVANAISVLGNPTPYFLVAGLAFLIFKGAWPHPIKANRALFVLVAATAPALSTDLLKVAFARSRPSLFLEQGLYAFRFFHNAPEFASFPSEHATVVSAMAAALSVLFPAYVLPLGACDRGVPIGACRPLPQRRARRFRRWNLLRRDFAGSVHAFRMACKCAAKLVFWP